MISRRRFLTTGAVLLGVPLAVQAQPPPGKTARIGYVTFRSGPSHLEEAFREGLRELGYVEGRNISIDYRWGDSKPDRVSAQATELARLKVDIIVSTGGNAAALAVKKAITTIPVVFTSGDPVGAGLVASLDRPGANLTGINLLTIELNTKRLELLKDAVPGVSRVAVLVNPASPTARTTLKDLEAAARSLRVGLQFLEAKDPQAIDDAFTAVTRDRTPALLVVSDAMFFGERERITRLVQKTRVPAIFEFREYVERGGLMSYGASIADMYRRLGAYVDKILKGAKPADLPVEQPTKFELVINLKTARALRLTIPPSLLLRADRVIE